MKNLALFPYIELETKYRAIQIYKISTSLAGMAQLVGASSHKAKGRRFNSRSGYMPGLPVQSQVRASTRSNQLMFLFHVNVSLSLFLPPFPLSKN